MGMTINKDSYFKWLLNYIDKPDIDNFHTLLCRLFNTDFVCIIPRDGNRANDGLDLRYSYYKETGEDITDDRNCTILEMMIALSDRCEIEFMSSSEFDNRTSQWFWEMIDNLGLSSMNDFNYDERYVELVLDRFLLRQYSPNGEGGLFVIPNAKEDLTKVEIWYQLNWYINNKFDY